MKITALQISGNNPQYKHIEDSINRNLGVILPEIAQILGIDNGGGISYISNLFSKDIFTLLSNGHSCIQPLPEKTFKWLKDLTITEVEKEITINAKAFEFFDEFKRCLDKNLIEELAFVGFTFDVFDKEINGSTFYADFNDRMIIIRNEHEEKIAHLMLDDDTLVTMVANNQILVKE